MAETLPLVSALDHFLIGKERYKQGDWAARYPHFDAALMASRATSGHTASQPSAASSSTGRSRPRPTQRLPPGRTRPRLALRVAGIRLVRGRHHGPHRGRKLARRGRTLRTEILLQLQAAEVDYDKALELLDAAPNKDLRYPLLVNRGLLWLERRASGTRPWRTSRRRSSSTTGGGWRLRTWARSISNKTNLDQAIEQFTRAIERRPDRAPLFRFRAGVNLGPQGSNCRERPARWPTWTRPSGSSRKRVPSLAQDYTRRARLLHLEGREEDAWPRARRP